MSSNNDPIGVAIQDFLQDQHLPFITVQSDLCEDDELPVPYLFRTFNEMPVLEQKAMELCKGTVLDIGAGAGCHSKYLKEKGHSILALDTSKGAVEHLSQNGIENQQIDFHKFNGQQFDTILLLMNGIGLAGSIENLKKSLLHLKTLLNPEGQIILDSTDIKYMYENEDGSMWMDLSANYYGEMKFNMTYKDQESGWFDWLYIDPQKLTEYATEVGFDVEIAFENDNYHYLAVLQIDDE